MANIAAPLPLDAPPVSPAVHRYSLLQVANGPLALPRLTEMQYRVPWCEAATAYDIDCESPPGLAEGPSTVLVSAPPFVVDADLSCPIVGYPYERVDRDVRAKLTATEHVAVEEHLADQMLSWPGLVSLGDALDIVDAISVAEHHAYTTARYGLPAFIHVPARQWAYVSSETLARWSSPRWVTALGSWLVPNVGLPEDTIVVTGQVVLWSSAAPDVTPVQQAANRSTNRWNMHAQRDWAAGFECFAASVTVPTTSPTSPESP